MDNMFIFGNIYYNNMSYIKWIRLLNWSLNSIFCLYNSVYYKKMCLSPVFATLMTGKPFYSGGSFISVTRFFFFPDSSS